MATIAGAGVLAACGGSGNTTAGSGNTKLTTVTYRSNFVTSGLDAPIWYASELGYYKQLGLKVNFEAGTTTTATIDDVAAGHTDFGLALGSVLEQAITQKLPIKAVATTIGSSTFGFFVPKKDHITSIKQLNGKTILGSSIVGSLVDTAATMGGANPKTMKFDAIDPSSLVSTYAGGQGDSMYTTAIFAGPAVQTERPSNVLLQSSVGFNPPDYAIITTDKLLKTNPSLVRKFVLGTLRGWVAMRKNPTAAVNALVAQNPAVSRAQMLAEIKALTPFLCSKTQMGKPYGMNAPSDWSSSAKAYSQFVSMPGSLAATRFETNEFFTGKDAINVGTCS